MEFSSVGGGGSPASRIMGERYALGMEAQGIYTNNHWNGSLCARGQQAIAVAPWPAPDESYGAPAGRWPQLSVRGG
ncbi:hypothetical protein GCM10009838_15320 [Catenulispora subtropica]|uniref:Uncharacterized protein n=1 Tax=Catenulispora subtropica TaxID=450798 RepID=A0ABN2QXI2_9ACTN